ncbi:hypothetical protein [Puniceibacterium sediminis]|uniref:Uncharacterized protein n=1 Tax=Puniceibacterium sediminis TaxID=1608407 RepID=A0A238VFI7_9RHOB|nr:hypothetical protein [Puniceibacterium sediminis]SNR32981.1 hypothetical protein SAMN06265370_10276 [Puniceibacterium sediminis]
MHNAKILNAIACDEVRREASGKHIIIGARGGVVVYSGPKDAEPPTDQLAFYIQVSIFEKAELEFIFRRKGSKQNLMHVKGEMVANQTDQFRELFGNEKPICLPVILDPETIEFATTGDYELVGSVDGKNFKKLIELNVIVEREEQQQKDDS